METCEQIAPALKIVVLEDPDRGIDVGGKPPGGAREMLSEHDGPNEVPIEEIPEELGLNAISCLIQGMHATGDWSG